MGEARAAVPRKVKGFRDIDPETNRLRWHIVRRAAEVYERYGFEHWDTPALEYADCLGRHLPDDDTPEEGIYAFRNPEREPVLDERGRELRDEHNRVLLERHALALRYDLTAPLARLYAERLWPRLQQGGQLGKPPLFRRYQYGPVYRFEAKLDPGRYREFWQLDFDTVGSDAPAADAEVACVLCDALEAIGLERGSYRLRVNDRQLHQGLFERIGLEDPERQRDVLRVVDKVDKLGLEGVAAELSGGRTDPVSGARIPGLGLDDARVEAVVGFMASCEGVGARAEVLSRLREQVGGTPSGERGLERLGRVHELLDGLGYAEDRVVFDPSVARGLAYYTGPVFEVESLLEYRDDRGRLRRFGAIAGGGRYDGLVQKLLGLRVPATGASIGVDRLAELLRRVRAAPPASGPVLVVVMDPSHELDYLRMAAELRAAGIPAEVYFGLKRRLKTQFAYADQRGAPVAVVAGGDEFARGTVSLKDLRLGALLSRRIADREEWTRQPAQVEVPRERLVEEVRRMIERPLPQD